MSTSILDSVRQRSAGRRRAPRFSPSTILRLESIDKENNTLDGVIEGGERHGERLKGIRVGGKTKPRNLTQKTHRAYMDPKKIEAGEAVLILDRLKMENGKLAATWMRHGGPEVVVSTPDNPQYMTFQPMKAFWDNEDDDDKPIRKYTVVTIHPNEGRNVSSLDDFKDAFIEMAADKNGFGSFNVSLIAPDAVDRQDMPVYAGRRGDDGEPLASPEERYEQFLSEQLDAEQLGKLIENGVTLTLTPTEQRTLSKFEVKALEDDEEKFRHYSLPSHGDRLAWAIAYDDDLRTKVQRHFHQWAMSRGLEVASLQEASDKVVGEYAEAIGAPLPARDRRAFLPTGFTMRGPDNEKFRQFVTRIVHTGQALPANFIPVPGDEKGPERFYGAYKALADAAFKAPAITVPRQEAEAEAVAEAAEELPPEPDPEPEGAEPEQQGSDMTMEELSEMLSP